MFFKNKKHELAIAEAKAREAEAMAKAAEAEKAKEYNKLAAIQMLQEMEAPEAVKEIEAPYIPENVIPKGKKTAVAMDSACSSHVYNSLQQNVQFFPQFEGFPKLAYMAQSSDYFSVVETTANEMTREWGEFKILDGDDAEDDQKEKVKQLNDAFEKFNIKDIMNRHIRNELIFGRSQLYIDVSTKDEYLHTPLLVDPKTISKGSFKGVTVVEPIWSTPSEYNSTDPTKSSFFKPDRWWVLGKEIHSSRLLTMVNRPVPDMYKPAYNFSGLSMLQLMQPYVERWQRAVDSSADLLESFSLSGLKTDIQNILSGGIETAAEMINRAEMFSRFKNNRGMLMLDKDTEEFFQFNTPLTGVPDLMRHLQEQMAAPSHTPLVKLLGITPNGMNASSEGEIRVYYDYISAQQEFNLLWQIHKISDVVQLHLFGEIDQSIGFVFNPLYQLDEKEISEKLLSDVQSLSMLLQSNSITPEEIRRAIAGQDEWIMSFIDPKEVPEPMEDLDFGEETESFSAERLQA